MPNSELIFGALLVAGLLAAAGSFAWAQVATLRRAARLPDEERAFESTRAYRRLVGCALLAVMAGLLVAQYALWEWRVKHLVQPVPEEEKVYARLWVGAWVALLLALLAVVVLTAIEAFVTRSHALKQSRRLSEERRAMIQRQAARIREGDG
ncbi:MAG: hypothetical protein ACRC33_18425 [Gemmataceae bacterium]